MGGDLVKPNIIALRRSTLLSEKLITLTNSVFYFG